jgi:hypothetical protein
MKCLTSAALPAHYVDPASRTHNSRGNGKGKRAKTAKQTFWCIRADVVRKLDRGDPEPETLASGSAASSDALDASDPTPF